MAKKIKSKDTVELHSGNSLTKRLRRSLLNEYLAYLLSKRKISSDTHIKRLKLLGIASEQ